MPYDAEKASDVSSMKEKLSKTYSGVNDTAARQAIHVWNSVMDGGGDEGRAWASVYAAMNKRGLGKKAYNYGSTFVMTGRTFQNKDLIKSIFGSALEWDAKLKRWLGYGGGNGMDKNVWALRRSGVQVAILPGIRLKPGEPIPDKYLKGASRVAERFLLASAASRVAGMHLLAAAPTLKLLADTIERMAITVEDGQKTIDTPKAEQILKRWLSHAEKEGAKYAEITVGPLKKDSWNRWSITPSVRDTFKSGSNTAPWVSWEGTDKLYITIERDFDHWDVSITDRQGRIVFDSDSIPKAVPAQIILALVMDRPRFVSTRVWQEENDYREERIADWSSDVTPWD